MVVSPVCTTLVLTMKQNTTTMTTTTYFWGQEIKHELRNQSDITLAYVRFCFSHLMESKYNPTTDSFYFDTDDHFIEFYWVTEDVFFIYFDGEEYYFDNSTNEMLFDIS